MFNSSLAARHNHAVNSTESSQANLRQIHLLLWIVILGLVLSGATAIPLEAELRILSRWIQHPWIVRVRDGLIDTYAKYPFIGYGTDWLAFGHFAIAIAFIGPLRDPLRNIWVIEFGMIACALVIPCALIMGQVRDIPLGWRLIDCSFGVLGIIPLWLCCRQIKALAPRRDISP
ncbi:MAG: hypothetical protein L0Z53_16795 [Acidobacteriales bacterium]|nr:hypothetical protein [Terriglobales bacterium]